MTKHLSYILEGIEMIALYVVIIIALVLIAIIVLFPAFMYIELGVSWAFWIYIVHFFVLSYLAGRYGHL